MIQQNSNIKFVPLSNNPKFINRTGQILGYLTVLGFASFHRKMAMWFCQCKCGTISTVYGSNLGRNNTRSCGCLQQKRTSLAFTTHGENKNGITSVEYTAYGIAKSRCNNPKNIDYDLYGKRGIEFRYTSFEEFLADIGRKPTPQHSIDRINNDGHYESGNVRWADPCEQANNKRNNHMITWKGKTQTMIMWCRELHLNRGTLESRLNRYGWSIERALSAPTRALLPHFRKGKWISTSTVGTS